MYIEVVDAPTASGAADDADDFTRHLRVPTLLRIFKVINYIQGLVIWTRYKQWQVATGNDRSWVVIAICTDSVSLCKETRKMQCAASHYVK